MYLCIKKQHLRIFLCLVGSYVFYGWWDWRFLSLIIFSTFVDYYLGNKIFKINNRNKKKRYLYISLVSNLGLLFFFKYFNFFIESFIQLSEQFGINASIHTLNIILPVGISFYTFQTLSYTIDIYNNKIEPENNILTFATFVAFFPQLVAGPIVRASELLPQFKEKVKINQSIILSGLTLIFIGFFKKVVLADSLAPLVDDGFQNYSNYSSLNLILIVVFYSFQIYCDFSGYSDIAIGVGKLLGYDFPINFNFPYIAKNLSDFWRRWHISLSSWLRDYLYIPLGGNKNGYIKTQINLMLTMLLGGLWHGANWTFVIWGFMHGGYLILQRVLNPLFIQIKQSLPIWLYLGLSIVITYFLVDIAWVFFRSQNVSEAFVIFDRIFQGNDFSFSALKPKFEIIKSVGLIVLLFGCEILYISFKDQVLAFYYSKPFIQIFFFSIILWLILLFGSFQNNNFIYFQF